MTCVWCTSPEAHGYECPRLAAVEFHPDGVSLKRVEFVKADAAVSPALESDDAFRARLLLLVGPGSINAEAIQKADTAGLDHYAGVYGIKRT